MNEQPPLIQRVLSLPGFGLLLALLIFACFPDVLIGRSSFYFRDYGVLGYPVVHHWRESMLAGEVPLWNPLSNCGVPFLAQWGTMCVYPLSAILLLPLPWSLSVFCFFHLWLAGIGMYLLARRWTANNFAAAFAGAAFVFNGIVFASFIWPNYFVAFAWMPFVVLTVERAWREGGRWTVAAALVSALQLGSGVPEIIVFTWLVAGLLWVLDFGDEAGSGARMFARLLGVVGLAAALMAVQLLPFFELLVHSHRESGFAGSKWSLPVWAGANLIAPLLNCFETPNGQYFQYGQEFMSSVYLGVPAVLLALIGVMKFSTLRSWGLLLLAIGAVVLAFGDYTPIFPAIRKAIPFVGIARYPVKFLFLAAFIVPLLASLSIRALHVEPRVTRGTIIGGAVLMLFLLAGLLWAAHNQRLADMSQWPENFRQNATLSLKDATLNTKEIAAKFPSTRSFSLILISMPIRALVFVGIIAGVLLSVRPGAIGVAGAISSLALLAFDARTHAPNQNPTLPVSEFQGSAWDDSIGSRPRFGHSRVFIAPPAEDFLLTVSSTNASRVWQAKRRALWSNLNLLEAAPKVNGSATLQIREQAQFQKALYTTNASPGILDFLGVAYVNSNRFEWTPRPGVLPIITAGQRVVFADDTNALQSLLARDFDARSTVFLAPSARALVAATNGGMISILSSNISTHRLALEVEAKEAGLVVVAQSFYPAWKATVDGQAVPLHRANVAFQAVAVPAGRHQVEFKYDDTMFRTGGAISGVALIACPLFWWLARRRK
jgi:hypothetical protein